MIDVAGFINQPLFFFILTFNNFSTLSYAKKKKEKKEIP